MKITFVIDYFLSENLEYYFLKDQIYISLHLQDEST